MVFAKVVLSAGHSGPSGSFGVLRIPSGSFGVLRGPSGSFGSSRQPFEEAVRQDEQELEVPNTPWDRYIYQSIGVVIRGVGGIYDRHGVFGFIQLPPFRFSFFVPTSPACDRSYHIFCDALVRVGQKARRWLISEVKNICLFCRSIHPMMTNTKTNNAKKPQPTRIQWPTG